MYVPIELTVAGPSWNEMLTLLITAGLLVCAAAEAWAAHKQVQTAGRLEKAQDKFFDLQKQQADIQQKQYELQKQVDEEKRRPRSIATLIGEPHGMNSIRVAVDVVNLAAEPLWIEEGRAIIRGKDGAERSLVTGNPIRAYVLEREQFDITSWIKDHTVSGDRVSVSVLLLCRSLSTDSEIRTLWYPVKVGPEGPFSIGTPER